LGLVFHLSCGQNHCSGCSRMYPSRTLVKRAVFSTRSFCRLPLDKRGISSPTITLSRLSFCEASKWKYRRSSQNQEGRSIGGRDRFPKVPEDPHSRGDHGSTISPLEQIGWGGGRPFGMPDYPCLSLHQPAIRYQVIRGRNTSKDISHRTARAPDLAGGR
jgi:hypothetical protein